MAVEIKNKKASYTYFLTDDFTAGLVLSGSEIKSIRGGKASITESYCRFEKGELWVYNMYVAEKRRQFDEMYSVGPEVTCSFDVACRPSTAGIAPH